MGERFKDSIDIYRNQGKDANINTFRLNQGGEPSILNVDIGELRHDIYMFSPQWQKLNGLSKLSDEQLMRVIETQDAESARQMRQRIQQQKKEEEEKRKQKEREEQILNYSAQVKDGFIEVAVPDDEDDMFRTFQEYNDKWREMQSKNNLSDTDLEKMGFPVYTWDEWKKLYRKTHGLPENGIKRIPYEGKRKTRNIDWGPRAALSKSEMEKYGIRMSETGPTMIPIEKAMTVAGSLLNTAKNIYSVRDGLEVVKLGIDTRMQELKKRNDNGVPISVVANDSGSNPVTNVTDPHN